VEALNQHTKHAIAVFPVSIETKLNRPFIDGEFTVKRLKVEKDFCWLLPEKEFYKPINVTAKMILLFGV
jgi:hypothetical protein